MNKEKLTEAIVALDPDAEVAEKTNAELETLLASLTPPPAPPAPEGNPEGSAVDAAQAREKAQAVKAETVRVKSVHVIASGRSCTSKRGILAEGEAVRADDFVNGKVDFDRLIEDVCIVENR